MKNYIPNYVDTSITKLFDYFPKYNWDEQDLFIYKLVKKHIKYKRLCIIGYILWPLAVFWFPIVCGKIFEFVRFITNGFCIPYKIGGDNSIMYILEFSFTYPVTVPLFILFGFVINPLILKEIIFSKKYKYNENVMEAINFSKSNRNKISFGALSGTIFGKYITH